MIKIHANCPLCNEPTETAATDKRGRAVHDDCLDAFSRAQNRILVSSSRSLLILRSLATSEQERAVA